VNRQRILHLSLALALAGLCFVLPAVAQQRSGDYFPAHILDRPLGVERLPNGNTLITDGGGAHYTATDASILEVSPAGDIVWQYVGDLAFPHSAERLPGGNTLIANSEENVVVEVSPAGEVVWSTGGGEVLDWPRDADRLDNGNTLITDSRHNRVVEVDPGGQPIWSYGGLALPYESDRLPNGNTLIADNDHLRVIEVNPAGEIVWTFRNLEESLSATLENGGFEQDADGDGLPDAWYPADLNAEGEARFLWDGTVVKEGRHSAGGQYRGPGRMSWLQVVTVEPEAEYRFSGYLKAQILNGVVAYQLWFVDPLGGPLGEPITVAAHQTSTDWAKDELELRAPAGAEAVQIWGQIIADGRAWFDDVRWEKVRSGSIPWWLVAAAAVLVVAGIGGTWLRARRQPATLRKGTGQDA